MRIIVYLILLLFASLSNAETWTSLSLNGKALYDKLSGPYLSFGEMTAASTFDCTQGSKSYHCSWLPIYNNANSFSFYYENQMGNADMIAIAWTLNNIPSNPNPAQGTYAINGTANNGSQGYKYTLPTGINPDTCTSSGKVACIVNVSFSLPIYMLVTTGPSGTYMVNGVSRSAIQEGSTIYARWTLISGGNMGYVYQGDSSQANSSLVVPPIEEPLVSCDFSLSPSTLDLGTVTSFDATGKKTSSMLNATCTDDASIELTINQVRPNNMGGLDILIYFEDDKTTSAKTGWKVTRNLTSSLSLNAEITGVGALTPGEYTHSGIISVIYD